MKCPLLFYIPASKPRFLKFSIWPGTSIFIRDPFRTGEKAIAGRTAGLIEFGETVTWKARHLGVMQTLTTKIVTMQKPYHFTDIMLKGTFRSMKHQHLFRQEDRYTVMTDIFEFESPFGIIGKIFNAIFLRNYMKQFLLERNRMIKSAAEADF
ncbi:SRPBCC family protein [uncultured Chryseobacterium sp.]|uniref:SRPBCC family protein n=1 Tax=uncultured Chryseobacterium sp. TaxID=259322 RepID=UPI0025F5CDDA|nr:SRPBCC family protein [uncultured Chryseobacterium sp.]